MRHPPSPGSFLGRDLTVNSSSTGRAATTAPTAHPSPVRLAPGTVLALQLWLTSMLCWWVIGITFSRLWWLVNATQLDWILFCYAWEVPAVGWTGAVALPYIIFRRLQTRLEAGDPAIGPDLARYPLRVALLVIATSSIGYLLGALQIDHFAHLPTLEFVKPRSRAPCWATLRGRGLPDRGERGPAPGAAAFTGRRVRVAAHPAALRQAALDHARGGDRRGGAGWLYGLTQWQLLRETTRAEALLAALDGVSSTLALDGPLSGFGDHTEGLIVRRSNNYIIWGAGRGRVLYGDGRRDFQPIQRFNRGWFASRDDEHKVVAYEYRPRRAARRGRRRAGRHLAVHRLRRRADRGRASRPRRGRWRARHRAGVGRDDGAEHRDPDQAPQGRRRPNGRRRLDVEPVALVRGDEVAELARAFDRMAARVRTDEADLRSAYDRCSVTRVRSCSTNGSRPWAGWSRAWPTSSTIRSRPCSSWRRTSSTGRGEAGRSRGAGADRQSGAALPVDRARPALVRPRPRAAGPRGPTSVGPGELCPTQRGADPQLHERPARGGGSSAGAARLGSTGSVWSRC